jgi:DNA-binding LacI/PurR family transcriptional regulator
VLAAVPDADVSRFYRAQMLETMRRKFSAAGYAFSIVTFPLHGGEGLAALKLELLRATDFAIAMRATPAVQKCIRESGIPHVYAFGDKPKAGGQPWIRFSMAPALSLFADHCARAGVKRLAQVRFEENGMFDAQPALGQKGIECSWLEIPRQGNGSWAFEDSVRQSYETFAAMPRRDFPDLFLFWTSFLAQGAITAFLERKIHMPDDVKAVSLSSVGLGPVYSRPFTRIEINPVEAGEKLAAYALAVLAKGRLPRPPLITPKYVFGRTFPF